MTPTKSQSMTPTVSQSMTPTVSQSMTPRSKTKLQITEAGLSTKQSSMVKKQLLLGNVVQSQLNSTRKQMRPSHVRMLRNMIGGTILKKYRLAKIISMNTGLGRNQLSISDGTFPLYRYQMEHCHCIDIRWNIAIVSISNGTLPLKLRRKREIRKYKAQVMDIRHR